MKYTYVFTGEITVEADSEEESYRMANDLVAPSQYAYDNCVGISVDNIHLVDEIDDEEVDEIDDEESEILNDYDTCWKDGDSGLNDCRKCPHRFDCDEWFDIDED